MEFSIIPTEADEREMVDLEQRPYPNEHAARVTDPDQYDSFRRQNNKFKSGIHAIWGIKKGPPRKSELQSVRFDKTKYSVSEAKAWLKKNDIKYILFEPASNKAEIGDMKPITNDRELTRHVMDSLSSEASNALAGAAFSIDGDLVRVQPKEPIERFFHSDGEIRASDDDDDLVELSFSSELPVSSWYRENEILSHEPGDANFSRLDNVGAVLKNHDPNRIVGKPVEVWLDEKKRKGRMKMRFGSTIEAQRAKHEALTDKTLRGVSVGYLVSELIFLKDKDVKYKGRIRGPAWVASKWEAYEASLTPIPKDATVGIGRKWDTPEDDNKETMTMGKKRNEDEAKAPGEEPKTPEESKTPEEPKAPEAPKAPESETPAEKALETERSRALEITRLCRAHKLEAEADALIRGGKSISEVREFILGKLETQHPPVEKGGEARVMEDSRRSFRSAVCEGLDLRAQTIEQKDVKHDGQTFANMSLIQIARECLKVAGIPFERRSKDEILDLALAGPKITPGVLRDFMQGRDTIAGTTSDFPYILAVTANKSLLSGYNSRTPTYRQWCKVGSLSDFKVWNRIRMSEAGDLELIPEAGKYQSVHFAERQETVQLATYGRKWDISRQALINDDMDAFTTVPAKLGRAAARLPGQLAATVLLANGNLADGNALFSNAHNNQSDDADLALDTLAHAHAGLKAIVLKLRTQAGYLHAIDTTESKKLTLDLEPSILLAGPTNEMIAKQAVGSATDITQSNANVINPLQGIATVVVEPLLEDTNITGYSTTHYFMFADPADAAIIEVGFLNGVTEPYMEERDQIDADGRLFKIRLDCGADTIGYEGAQREQGAS